MLSLDSSQERQERENKIRSLFYSSLTHNEGTLLRIYFQKFMIHKYIIDIATNVHS